MLRVLTDAEAGVSVLFNEPKLLKYSQAVRIVAHTGSFSALQRAEIAEIGRAGARARRRGRVSVLFNEPKLLKSYEIFVSGAEAYSFSALQRAEIAEMALCAVAAAVWYMVSVLFNEPKLLKSSADGGGVSPARSFQCSSTSRNC